MGFLLNFSIRARTGDSVKRETEALNGHYNSIMNNFSSSVLVKGCYRDQQYFVCYILVLHSLEVRKTCEKNRSINNGRLVKDTVLRRGIQLFKLL